LLKPPLGVATDRLSKKGLKGLVVVVVVERTELQEIAQPLFYTLFCYLLSIDYLGTTTHTSPTILQGLCLPLDDLSSPRLNHLSLGLPL
jgi:hypothetical protein